MAKKIVGELIPFRTQENQDRKIGFADAEGNVIVPPKYAGFGDLEFIDGLITFVNMKDDTHGIMNQKCEILRDSTKNTIVYRGGIGVIEDMSRSFYAIDANNEIIVPMKYSFLQYFPDMECFYFETPNGEYGLLERANADNKECQVILDFKAKGYKTPQKPLYNRFNKGVMMVQNENELYGVINKCGDELVPFKYTGYILGNIGRGLITREAETEKEVQITAIDENHVEVVPFVAAPSDGKGGWGDKGDNLKDIGESYYKSQTEDGFVIYDDNDNIVHTFPKDQEPMEVMCFDKNEGQGTCLVKIYNSETYGRGFCKLNGEMVCQCKYISIDKEQSGFNRIAVKCVGSDQKWGFIDYEGNEVVPCIYDSVVNLYQHGFGLGKQGRKWIKI